MDSDDFCNPANGWGTGSSETKLELHECRVLRIEPGDIVVLEVERPLSREDVASIKRQFEAMLANAGHAGVPTMVLSECHLTKTRVVSDDELAEAVSRPGLKQRARE